LFDFIFPGNLPAIVDRINPGRLMGIPTLFRNNPPGKHPAHGKEHYL